MSKTKAISKTVQTQDRDCFSAPTHVLT